MEPVESLAVKPGLEPMEARLVDALPDGPAWRYEPKWDGFRCLLFRAGHSIVLQSKSGKPLGRYFPDIVEAAGALDNRELVLDGELLIPIGDTLSFDALQMRLHPAASRVRRLAREMPAQFMLFDSLLDEKGGSLLDSPLADRRASLEELHVGIKSPVFLLSPYTDERAVAETWLDRAGSALDGVVAKRSDEPYQPGQRAMLKIKRLRTADCVVGGFRYGSMRREVGSLLLGLYDDSGRLNHVGFTSAIPTAERAILTTRLEALIEAPGFSGSAPGGPSRWSADRSADWRPLRPELVVEVRYDHVTGSRFRHGTKFLRWRPDKAPRQCRMEQLRPEARPAELASLLTSTH
jgi:ATP-dependent DNA ligase